MATLEKPPSCDRCQSGGRYGVCPGQLGGPSRRCCSQKLRLVLRGRQDDQHSFRICCIGSTNIDIRSISISMSWTRHSNATSPLNYWSRTSSVISTTVRNSTRQRMRNGMLPSGCGIRSPGFVAPCSLAGQSPARHGTTTVASSRLTPTGSESPRILRSMRQGRWRFWPLHSRPGLKTPGLR
jgi:hypothetical protein